jgi:hypothetical protein
MSISAPAISTETQAAIPDKYTFQDGPGTTQVTYYPTGPGPIISGVTHAGPKIEYTGEEGDFTFSGNEIASVKCPLGNLISVTLRPNADAGALMFTLVLPSVTMSANSKVQSFRTIALKTHTSGRVLTAGADRSYDTMHLHGAAETVFLPA